MRIGVPTEIKNREFRVGLVPDSVKELTARVVIMGMPASDDLVAVDASDLASSAKSVIGTKMGSAMIREDIPMLIALYQKGELELDGLISHHFNFDQINEAIEVAATPSSLRVVVHFAHDE